MVFGADIIAGFPTETDAMFARSLDIVEECGLTHLHVFPFSPRPGTPAARMPPVARDVVKERARLLRAKGDEALKAHLEREVGTRRRVLIELNQLGRTEAFAPVRFSSPVERGDLREVTIWGMTAGICWRPKKNDPARLRVAIAGSADIAIGLEAQRLSPRACRLSSLPLAGRDRGWGWDDRVRNGGEAIAGATSRFLEHQVQL